MIDTHAHIDSDDFNDDRIDVINRAFSQGLEAIIIPAIEPTRFDNLIKTTELNKNIYFGIGVHPHNANDVDSIVLNEIYDIAKAEKKAIAIGEIGLDYYYDFSPKDVQKKVFREQLEIAKELDKPVIVHNRDSDEDILKIIGEAQDGKLKGVLHCFSGNLDFLRKAMNVNFLVSFTGNITFKKFNLIDTIKNVENDKFMFETDSPYMTPVPYRGKRNEPSYINLIAKKIAEIKNIELNEVIKMTNNNAKKLFGILNMILIIALFPILAFSQNEEQYYNEDAYQDTYNKFLGFGPVIGTNTIVESFIPNPNTVSYEGLLAIGGTVHYGPMDYLIISASYVYSQNRKKQEKFPDLQPDTYRHIELTANFIANPHGKINVYGFVGPSILLNTYGVPGGGLEERNSLGINTGLGFYFNLPISNAGLIVLSAEWKLDFMLGSQHYDYDFRINNPLEQQGKPVDVATFFSIPRINLLFYPEF